MRILVISYFNHWITHLGVELELAQVHLDKGDTVEFLGCDGCIEACQTNPDASKKICGVCRLKRARGIQLLRPRVVEHRLGDYLPDNVDELEVSVHSVIKDAESAKSFRYHGHDLGWGALSSTIMELRDTACESERALELLKRFAITSVRSYLAVKAFLNTHEEFDRVYVFNGRFACTRGAFRACQERGGLDIQIHERGSSVLKYDLFGNSLPHSRGLRYQRMEAAWDAAGDEAGRELVGKAFYEERRHGVPQAWKSFTARQEPGRLPADWDRTRRHILIFNSSEDEWAGIGDEWRSSVYPTQSEGIRRIVSDGVIRYPEAHFVLRMHPNLAGVANQDTESLYAIEAANFTLIEPASDVSTYALLDAAERVLTFGSTVGIEATYCGKVSILAGRSIYEDLDATYLARDHEHVMELLGAKLAPKPAVNALKYGFHARSSGIPFRYWRARGFEDGEFRGAALKWASATNLERRVLIRFLELGIRSRFLQDVIRRVLRITARFWFGSRKRVRIALGQEERRPASTNS